MWVRLRVEREPLALERAEPERESLLRNQAFFAKTRIKQVHGQRHQHHQQTAAETQEVIYPFHDSHAVTNSFIDNG